MLVHNALIGAEFFVGDTLKDCVTAVSRRNAVLAVGLACFPG